MFIKRFFAFVILPLFFLFSVSAHAVYDPNAKHSKWYVDRLMADPLRKSTVEIKAQRNYPVSTLGADGKPIIQNKVQKSVIKLAPKAANVGKSLIKRAPAIAITQAVIALLGKSVDWVMDAENNRIKYTLPAGSDNPDNPKLIYRTNYSGSVIDYYDASSAGARMCNIFRRGTFKALVGYTNQTSGIFSVECNAPSGGAGSVQILANPKYNPDAAPAAPQYIPIDQVAQKIIDQADAGEPAAMEVMSDSALDQLEAGLLNDQLEAAADPKVFNDGESDPTDPNAPIDPDAPTDPNAPNPDAKPFELPPFCSWAVIVCDFIEWYQAEPPEPEAPKSVPYGGLSEVGLDEVDRYEQRIDFQGQCPSSDFSFQMMGVTFAKPIPYHYLCDFLTQIAPWLLAMCYLGTAYFVVENV